MEADLKRMRQEYRQKSLTREELADDPISQFLNWFEAAVSAEIYEPNAMTLATCTAAGEPSARMVLLKDFDSRGFTFFTNYESRKAQELAQNGRAALVFWWGVLARQVRIEGQVDRLSAEESDAYFNVRPRGSQLGAWASPQSQVLPERSDLDTRLQKVETRFSKSVEIPRPNHWGGYRVVPYQIEFWQGRLSRLHDRFRYRRSAEGSWQIERLAP